MLCRVLRSSTRMTLTHGLLQMWIGSRHISIMSLHNATSTSTVRMQSILTIQRLTQREHRKHFLKIS